MNETVQVQITGISALLMHAFPLVPVEAYEKLPAEQQAELGAYRDPDTRMLYIPGAAFQRALVGAASYSKGKGRSTLQKPVAACVLVAPERASLGVSDYTIDSRPVVMPATRGRIMRHRPRLDKWAVGFEVEYDPRLLTAEQLRRVVDDAGSRVGLMDFRPERRGPFGRFMVTAWE